MLIVKGMERWGAVSVECGGVMRGRNTGRVGVSEFHDGA